MEFMNRDGRPGPQTNSGEQTTSTSAAASSTTHRRGGGRNTKLGHYASSLWVVSVLILIVGVILSILFTNPRLHDESRLVGRSQYQAVFLDGGQVYFGRIGYLGSRVLTLYDIYYLRVNQTVQPGQANSTQGEVTLAKLGCELHGPQDQMIISRDKVTFWENLKDDGQVVKAVKKYQKDFPNGQPCDQPAEDPKKTN